VREGLVLDKDPVLAGEVAELRHYLGRPEVFALPAISTTNFANIPGVLGSLPAYGDGPEVAIGVDSEARHFAPSIRPQVADALQTMATAELHIGLHAAGDLGRTRLERSAELLEGARQLLAPFVIGERGFLLSGRSRAEAGVIIGNPVQRRMTVGRQQRHEMIDGPLGRTFMTLGRLAMAEGDELGMCYLGTAHDRLFSGGDKVSQVRNVMYMMIAERGRDNRLGQLGWNLGRLAWGLTAATARAVTRRGQGEAWRVAGSLGKHLLTKKRAFAARISPQAL